VIVFPTPSAKFCPPAFIELLAPKAAEFTTPLAIVLFVPKVLFELILYNIKILKIFYFNQIIGAHFIW
jgi:hypothetical protein